ncbi:MAG: hypothetical protein OEZ51_08695 [Nitrospinota bacterium]|nr:hypothetical protein [Nitrospinota bacterium]
MTQDRIDFEKDILGLSLALLDKFKDDLIGSGITRRRTKLKRNQTGTKYLSEIQIELWDEYDLVGIEEYFVWEGEKPSSTKEDLKEWIEEFLRDLIEERKKIK